MWIMHIKVSQAHIIELIALCCHILDLIYGFVSQKRYNGKLQGVRNWKSLCFPEIIAASTTWTDGQFIKTESAPSVDKH